MPRLTRRNQTQLYISTAAAVHAALMSSPTFRKKPEATAHIAAEHAEAAVQEARLRARRKSR